MSSLKVPSLPKEHDLCRSAIVGQPKNWFYRDLTHIMLVLYHTKHPKSLLYTIEVL